MEGEKWQLLHELENRIKFTKVSGNVEWGLEKDNGKGYEKLLGVVK